MPRLDSRLLYMGHIRARGTELFAAACARDLEGIIGKWAKGPYEADGVATSWVKIKNPAYSQMVGRRELFETRQDRRQRSRSGWRSPVLRLSASSDHPVLGAS